MSARVFREEALRRHAARGERPRLREPGVTAFVVLWLVVVALVAVLCLLSLPVLDGGGSSGGAGAVSDGGGSAGGAGAVPGGGGRG